MSHLICFGCPGVQVIKKFPEVTACSVEERLKENMAKLERDWKIKGPTAANVIKRQPQVCHTVQTSFVGKALLCCLAGYASHQEHVQ